MPDEHGAPDGAHRPGCPSMVIAPMVAVAQTGARGVGTARVAVGSGADRDAGAHRSLGSTLEPFATARLVQQRLVVRRLPAQRDALLLACGQIADGDRCSGHPDRARTAFEGIAAHERAGVGQRVLDHHVLRDLVTGVLDADGVAEGLVEEGAERTGVLDGGLGRVVGCGGVGVGVGVGVPGGRRPAGRAAVEVDLRRGSGWLIRTGRSRCRPASRPRCRSSS